MNRRMLTLLVGVFLTAATALTWTKLSSTYRMQSAATALHDRQTQFERHARELEQQLAQMAHAASEAKSATTPAKSPPTTTAPIKPKPRPDAATLMAQNPKLRELFEHYSRSDLGLRYRPFYRAAQLTSEQIVRFQALVIEQKQEQFDLESAARSSGLAESEHAKLSANAEQQHSIEQRQLLGDEAFIAYQEFQRIEPMQGYVASVACLGIGTAEPLTEVQGERLLDILAKANSSYKSGGKADGELNWPQVLVQVQRILSPEQARVLQGRADLTRVFALAAQYQTQSEQAGH